MIKINRKYLLAASFVAVTLTTVTSAFFYHKKNHNRLLLSCNFDVHVHDQTNAVRLDKNTHLFYYSSGNGFRTEKGIIDINKDRYYLDRDIHFVFDDSDQDGTMTLEYTRRDKRANDNAPDNTWGAESLPGTKYYFSVSEIVPGIYLFRERGQPITICSSHVNL